MSHPHYTTLREATVTAAALGMSLAADERFLGWYAAPRWGGMAGLYAYLADIAIEIEREVERRSLVWGEDVDHYVTVDAAVDALLGDTVGDTAIAVHAVTVGARFLAGDGR